MARLRLLALGLMLLLAQQLVVSLLPVWMRPDLPLLLALALGLRARATESLVMAFALGFAVDALSGAPMGLHALLRGTACVASRTVDRALFLRAAAPWLLFAAFWAVADSALLVGLLQLVSPEAAPGWGEFGLRIPGVALSNALLALPVLQAVRWAEGDADGESSGFLVGSRP
jgi:rod shape-determining protein MreD